MPRLERDGEAVDALALERVDVEEHAVVRDLVAGLGGTAELPEDEAADRVVVLVGEVAGELLVEVVDGERAVDADGVVADALDGLVRQVELVLDLADDLLEQILERDDPLHRAVLVDHDGEMLVRAPELREQGGEILRLGHHRDRPHELGGLHRGEPAVVHRLDQVADVQHADDVVERLAVDGVPGVRRFEHRLQRLLGRQVDGDRDHLGPRHHHVRDLLVAEVEDLVEHLLLRVLDLALVGRAREQHAELGLGVRLHARFRADAGRAARRIASVELCSSQISGRSVRKNRRTGPGDEQRHTLRVVERDPLGHELADHDVQVRDDQQREDDRQEAGHHRVEARAEHLLAQRADAERRDRHAELHRGDEPRRVARDPSDRPGAAIAAVLELQDPRAPRGDEPVLGRDEERVEQEQADEGE